MPTIRLGTVPRGTSPVVAGGVRLVGLGVSLGLLACNPVEEECSGLCGPGTRCVDNQCVVAEPESDAKPDLHDEPKGKKKRRGRRGARGRAGPASASLGPALKVDDSHVPKYNPNRTEVIRDGDGTARLPDREVRKHLGRLEPKFNACIEKAARATNDTLSGLVKFAIGIEPSGKVWGVNVSAPAALKKAGIVACVRVAVYKSRFPSWDGPSMGVDYSFDVG